MTLCSRRPLVMLVGAFTFLLPGSAVARDAHYRVVRGDTLHAIAGRFLTARRGSGDLQRYNQIGNPRRLFPGQIVRIPESWLRRERQFARLVHFSGDVTVIIGAAAQQPRNGLAIPADSMVATRRQSFATLELPDATVLSVLPESVVRIARLDSQALTGTVRREVRIDRGRINTRATPFSDPRSRLEVVTPTATASVRGTEFRTSHDPDGAVTRVEVLEGKVAVISSGEVLVPAGSGIPVSAVTAPRAATLLAAPQLVDPGHLQDSQTLRFSVVPSADAKRWHGVLARDAGFVETIEESWSDGPVLEFGAQPDGRYFLQISAISHEGLEGRSQDYAVARERYRFGASLEQVDTGTARLFRFRWHHAPDGTSTYRFVLRRAEGDDLPLIDEPGLRASAMTVTNLSPGRYRWRVGRISPSDAAPGYEWDGDHDLIVADES